MTNKRLGALALLSVIVFTMTGCFFDQPLSGPDKNIDTWLLGVWEYKNDKGETYRAGIVPTDYDHFRIWVRKTGLKPGDTKNYRFSVWISRVDRTYFLCAKCEQSPGDIPPGEHIFLNYVVTGPNKVVLRQLVFNAPQNATSFQLRAAVREMLKKRALYANEGITVNRIGQIYMNPGGPNVLDLPLLPLNAPAILMPSGAVKPAPVSAPNAIAPINNIPSY